MAQMDGAFVVSQSVSQSVMRCTDCFTDARNSRVHSLFAFISLASFFFGVIDQKRTIHTKPARYDVVVDVDGPRSHVS